MSNPQNFLRALAFVMGVLVFSTVVFAQTETQGTQFALYGMQSLASGQSLNSPVRANWSIIRRPPMPITILSFAFFDRSERSGAAI